MDLSAETAELWARLGRNDHGRGRVLMLVGAHDGAGVSTVARELALTVARRGSQSVWLVDLDVLAEVSQIGSIALDSGRYGDPGAPAAASPDGSSFLTVRPSHQAQDGQSPLRDADYVAAHQIGAYQWWATRFRVELLQPGQSVHILPGAAYWDAVRRHVDLVIVDAPAVDRSQASLTLAPYMDAIVLVVGADDPDVRGQGVMRDALAAAGGEIAGVFLNRIEVNPPGFIQALSP